MATRKLRGSGSEKSLSSAEQQAKEDVAHEAKTGRLYRANYFDKSGRTVLVMRPGFQNASSIDGQIKYLVYCMERAIMDLKPDQEQMVWLIDFQGWNMSSISVKLTRETAHMVKPFLEPKTYKKVKFVFSDPQSRKVMEELFDMDQLESIFGGKNSIGFDYETYAERMKEEDKKMTDDISSGCSSPSPSNISEFQQSDTASDGGSEASDEGDSSPLMKKYFKHGGCRGEDRRSSPTWLQRCGKC
ncbi:CRAL-TRIO domain-containing protein C23B6.04c [Camellia lanceoleosa]|uniref:CRAL-TRIO domain-containing protein C23B6.04c n=1 Tax=Camellia lanceoleosa TaxID=1840588 RepID=A0ACC0FUZ4_9ERIC|nr:CRAL-TRIO domain-containing protein C23B6.04c [Camellia lanceoleosa]